MGDQGRSKYYILMDALKTDIIEGKILPGDKIMSENMLSEKFGVSRQTVRRAISILVNEGYLVSEHGRGTFCAERKQKQSGSKNIAVISTYISDYIFPEVIQGINKVLTGRGYSIILKDTENSQQNEAACMADVMTKNIDGMIIEPSKSEIFCGNLSQYQALDRMNVPYIFIEGIYHSLKDRPSILMNDEEGGFLVTNYLLENGHRNLLGIFKMDDYQGRQRHNGFVRALRKFGLFYDPERVIWYHTEDRKIKPAAMLEAIMESNMEVDGIVCYSDQIALDVIRTLERLGKRVPEDISVTGYDNSFIAVNGPVKLTTIDHPKSLMGEMAAYLLLEKMDGIADVNSKVRRVIEPQLIIRDSCRRRKD